MKYLLDTNICIFLMKGIGLVGDKIKSTQLDKLFISEVTLAELKYGVAQSDRPIRNKASLDRFLIGLTVLPIRDALDIFAFEKARLRRVGEPLDDFDLLIGATAIHYDLTLVTNNTRHFQRLQGIKLEDWTK